MEPSVEAEILALEEQLDRARVDGDVALFARVLADEFRTTSPTGGISTREQLLDDTRARRFVVTASRAREIVVRPQGESVAVVTGIAGLTARFRGHNVSGDYAYTHVYARRDGRWQVVAAHTSRRVPDWTYLALTRLTQLFRLRRKG